MQRTKSKILSILLSLVMLLSLLPTTALAAGEITTGNAKVTAPVDGQTPSFIATSDEPEKYSVELLRWIDVENSRNITPGTLNDPASDYYNYTFKGGKEYIAVVKFTAVGDNKLSYSNSFTINGETTYWDGNGLKRCYRFTATGTGGEHIHSYGSDWKNDADNHWHECSCGDKKDTAAHTAGEWVIDTPATATRSGLKHKECTVCGYTMATETIPATGGGEGTEVYSATVADINITLPAGYTSKHINKLGEDRAIKITNTGTEILYISEPTLSGTNASDFSVRTFGNCVVVPGNTNKTAYAIDPKIGLAPGTYTATISCTDNNNKLSVPVTAKITLTVSDHNWDTSKWEFNPLTHWHKCTDSGCSAKRDEAAHNSDKVVGAKNATFDTDGYTGDKYCSICDRKMEIGKAIAAGKYIRESKATMTPAGIDNTISANDLVFTSLDTSKYTVGLWRVFDMTDTTLNTVGSTYKQYPHDKKFISGHKYAIEFEFEAVDPYVYDTMHGTHSSTFKLNDADTMMSVATTHAGSPSRRVELVAGEVGVATSVSGTALSWNEKDNAEYYLYPTTMSDADIRAQWKTSGTVSGYYTEYTVTKETISSTTVDGKAMKAQTFSFDTVPAGDYKLVIFKPEKYVPKIVEITVGTSDYSCGELKLWLYGDVNYDGAVDNVDAGQINRYVAGIGNVFSKGTATERTERLIAGDINCDGDVNNVDAGHINRHLAGVGSLFSKFN